MRLVTPPRRVHSPSPPRRRYREESPSASRPTARTGGNPFTYSVANPDGATHNFQRFTSKEDLKDAKKRVNEFDPALKVEDWIQHFEEITRQLTEEAKMEIFSDKMKHQKAFSWYLAARREGRYNFVRQWIAALRETFQRDPHQRKNALLHRRQHEGEDAGDFVRDINALCDDWKGMTTLDKVGYVIDNAHPRYQDALRFLGVKDQTLADITLSLRAAMQLANREPTQSPYGNSVPFPPMGSSSHNASFHSSAPPALPVTPVPYGPPPTNTTPSNYQLAHPTASPASASRTPGQSETRSCYECREVGHLAINCPVRIARLASEFAARQNNSGQNQQSHYNNKNGRNSGSRSSCTYCQRPGHTADVCRKRIREEAAVLRAARDRNSNSQAGPANPVATGANAVAIPNAPGNAN